MDCDADGDCLWAQVDGSEFIALETAGAYLDLSIIQSVSFTGLRDFTTTAKDNIVIFISNPEVGTYTYSSDYTLVYSDSDEKQYYAEAETGGIDITSFDKSTKEIEGTFTTTLINSDDNTITLNLTDGYFKVVLD